jgi:Mg2+/Co2+ transporter CorC
MSSNDSNSNKAIADVYSGDVAKSDSHFALGNLLFFIEADADPDAFSRIAGVFNFANKAIEAAKIERSDVDTLTFQIEIMDIAPTLAESLHRKLSQLTAVRVVAITRK